jgi:hypothetical protein
MLILKKLKEAVAYIKKINKSKLSALKIDDTPITDLFDGDLIKDWEYTGLTNCMFFEYNKVIK